MPRKNSLKPTKIDAKDSKFSFAKHFGTITSFPDEYDVDALLENRDQNKDGRPSACTSYMVTDIATDQDKVLYSHDYELMKTFEAMNVPPGSEGADGRTAFKIATTFGLLPRELQVPDIDKKLQVTAATQGNWPLELDQKTVKKPAYLPILRSGNDWFDAIRSAIYPATEPRSVGLCTQWSPDFRDTILPDNPRNLYWGHAYKVRGWKTIANEPYLWLKTWEGVDRFMSRTLCNKLMGTWGSYAATLRDLPEGTTIEQLKQTVTRLEVILALFQNIIRLKFNLHA